MIIGLANSKGGVEKSTIARNLVTYLNDIRIPTSLVDAEDGAPTAALLSRFDTSLAVRVASTVESIDEAVSELAASGHHVILDAPGKAGEQVSTLCLLSDLVIIPLCVSEQDLLQTVRIVEYVRQQQLRSQGRPAAVIVFTRTLKNDIATIPMRDFLKKTGIAVADTEIRERIAIKRNIAVMRDPIHYRNDGPANDFVALAEELGLTRQQAKTGAVNE